MESHRSRAVSSSGVVGNGILWNRGRQRRVGLAQRMGYFSRNGSNGTRTNHGSSASQFSGIVCDTMLGRCSYGDISITIFFDNIDGSVDDIPDALVVWNGCVNRVVEDSHFEECWFTGR